ncbi:MAG: fatty acid hydroxylase [Saprospiraceae bacterium]|jgi:beta-carotene 3-hydroxylase|nr:fatty acid hydroxylase [Chitinophagia bacterium]
MDILIKLGVVLITVVFMEFVAWFAHKYIMHGLLWSWHEDHHDPIHKEGFFEKNDRFFLVFAIPSALCYMLGSFYADLSILLFVGIGISIYGLIYFLIHDVYIHQRFHWFRQLDNKYSRAILRAHGAHHAIKTKEDCESFGLLVVHPKFFKKRSAWKSKTNESTSA